MKCEICGRDYVALGVHIKVKHKVEPDDYRDEFGILRTTPLVDADLSEHLSKAAKSRLTDDEYRQEVVERCKSNGAALKGGNGFDMTPQGRAALAKRNVAAEGNVKNKKIWIINGTAYKSSQAAAKAVGCRQSEVVRRCNGYTRRGRDYPPWAGWYWIEFDAQRIYG